MGMDMDWYQFWEWGIWAWLGNVIASQPFLNLMVPVATLTGVVITTKSNERTLHQKLQEQGEQWRYEVVKDSATDQRQAVLTFLTEVAELQAKMGEEFRKEHAELAEKDGLRSGEYEKELIDLNWEYWRRFSSKVDQSLLTLELSLADENVRAQVSRVRQVLREDEKMFTLPGGVEGNYLAPYDNEFFNASSPMSKPVEIALESLKETAIRHLHPLPPEVPVEQPPRRGLAWHKRELPPRQP